jgi:hypothetical protein
MVQRFTGARKLQFCISCHNTTAKSPIVLLIPVWSITAAMSTTTKICAVCVIHYYHAWCFRLTWECRAKGGWSRGERYAYNMKLVLTKLMCTCTMLRDAESCITPELVEPVSREHPRFLHFLNELGTDPVLIHKIFAGAPTNIHSWGEPPSSFRHFVRDTVQLASELPRFPRLAPDFGVQGATNDPWDILSLCDVLWEVPTDE